MDRQGHNRKSSKGMQAAAGSETAGVTQGQAAVSAELLFEATEALIRALSVLDPSLDNEAAIATAMRAEVLAPFDAPEVNQAVAFLHQLGYLSPEARRVP